MEGWRWVVSGVGETRREPFEIPDPGPGELLLRTEASLVSAGTELAIYTGIHQGLHDPRARWPRYPQPMGYMAVGQVVAVGPGESGFRPGDRLLTSTGHASHALVDPGAGEGSRVWKVPDDAPAHRMVLARMAKTAMAALTRVETTVAQSVVVAGLGIVGQMALRLFEAAGAWPLFGIDPVALRREAALRGGAAAVFDPGAGPPAEQLRRHVPAGADIAVDATGWAEALPGVMALPREGGAVVVLGSPRGRAPEVDFYSDLHRRSLRVLGAHDSGIGGRVREGFPFTNDRVGPFVVDRVYRGKLPVEDLITHRVPPSALPEMYEGLLHDKERFLGVVLDWSAGA